MSLLQNEEFAIFRLRTSYLANIQDGVGERLISVNTSFLNDPAYKTAGWSANPPELKRTYSPPIPAAVTSEYFKAPPPTLPGGDGYGLGEDDEEGGMVTGAGSNDTERPNLTAKRRRRREQLEEDDSSDLSDESEEESEAPARRPANQVRFEKLTTRSRSESSPIRSASQNDGPSVLVTSPSRPPEHQRLRRGSLGAVEAVKARERRGTTTSIETSSENDLHPSVFKRRQIQSNSSRQDGALGDQIKEDRGDSADNDSEAKELEEDDPDSDDSSLESEFSENEDSNPLLVGTPSDLRQGKLPDIAAGRPVTPQSISSKKDKQPSPNLPELPPPRPISTLPPVSALAAAIKAKNKKPSSPFDRFATLSGRGEPNPLYVKLYLPPSTQGVSEPLELLLLKTTNDGNPVTVGEAIGFSLWRYGDEGLQPPIPQSRMNVNWWTLRIVEDEEVDFDFPPLGRTRPLSDFTSNNNRPARGRSRDRPWDEFALVEATETQFQENEKATPQYSEEASEAKESEQETINEKPQRPTPLRLPSEQEIGRPGAPKRNVVIDPQAARKDGPSSALDTPTTPISHATPRSGAPKTLHIHYSGVDYTPHVVNVDVTTDTYIAEVFDQVCKKLNVDKALYILKVTRTTTIAPSDRTVEALGPNRQSLDLARRRFVGDGAFGLSGSPGSTSPNAPLLLTTTGTPKKSKKGMPAHPLAQQADLTGSAVGSSSKRYNVIRKQPMSFTPSQPRVLLLGEEYLHIMPGETGKDRVFDISQSKTTTVHFSSVVGCKVSRKHPKTFRVIVFRERESKRYDFEASSALEASEIVEEIKNGIEPYRGAINL